MNKQNVSPIIYNNGNRKKARLGGVIMTPTKLKELVLNDDTFIKYILVGLIHSVYNEEHPKEHPLLTKNDYDTFNWLLYEKAPDLRKPLLNYIQEGSISDIINSTILLYRDMKQYEAKQLIYSLSRLLYVQDKFKNNEIGQRIKEKIEQWILTYKLVEDIDLTKTDLTGFSSDEYEDFNHKLKAKLLYQIIPSLNYDIFLQAQNKTDTPFTDLFIYGIKDDELKAYGFNYINNMLNDSETYERYFTTINDFINELISDREFRDFLKAYKIDLSELKDIDQKEQLKGHTFKDIITEDYLKDYLDEFFKDPRIKDIYEKYEQYLEIQEPLLNNDDVAIWRKKADDFIKHLETLKKAKTTDMFNMDYMLRHLAYSDYQLKEYKLNIDDEIKKVKVPSQDKEIKKDNKLLQATSKQLKAIDNARGGLVTYNETDTQALKNAIKEKQESLKNTHIKQDKAKLKQEIDKLKSDLVIAEQKEDELKAEYKNVCDYLENIYKSMANEPKTSSYYKDLKRAKKQQEQRKKEIERIIRFNGWQLDLWGNGSYELVLNKRQKESLKLTIENLSKQIAKYTKEEQDIFDFLISKYLHNTDIKEIKFTLREYEETKKRVRPTNYLMGDIQAIRLLFREVWTYYTTSDKSYIFNEEHLFTKLNIKGELESDLNNLNNANLDTEISLEPTETLQNLLQDHDNYLYISTSLEIMQLNNDNEYLAKRLLKYLNYLARVNKKSVLNISLDTIIEELQHYGLKKFNMLDRHKTYKTEIVDVIDKTLSILEGENHLNKRFIEVLDRQPFINYDNEYRGKSQETSINEWGKHKIKIKVFDLDDTKLLETKQKQSKKKHKATKK